MQPSSRVHLKLCKKKETQHCTLHILNLHSNVFATGLFIGVSFAIPADDVANTAATGYCSNCFIQEVYFYLQPARPVRLVRQN